MSRVEKEKEIVELMIRLYCEKNISVRMNFVMIVGNF